MNNWVESGTGDQERSGDDQGRGDGDLKAALPPGMDLTVPGIAGPVSLGSGGGSIPAADLPGQMSSQATAAATAAVAAGLSAAQSALSDKAQAALGKAEQVLQAADKAQQAVASANKLLDAAQQGGLTEAAAALQHMPGMPQMPDLSHLPGLPSMPSLGTAMELPPGIAGPLNDIASLPSALPTMPSMPSLGAAMELPPGIAGPLKDISSLPLSLPTMPTMSGMEGLEGMGGTPGWAGPLTPTAALPRAEAPSLLSPLGPLNKELPLKGPALDMTPPDLSHQIPVEAGGSSSSSSSSSGGGDPQWEDNKRLFRFYSPLGGDKRLYLYTVDGLEVLNERFEFDLGLVSLNSEIQLKEVISRLVTVGVVQYDGSERYLNGYVVGFGFERTDAGWAHYRAQVVPWLHFLTLRQECRIFRDKTIVQIVEEVFGDYGGAAEYEFRLKRTYKPMDFIVQYQESDFNFVSRHIEREGWTYYFEHRKGGHKMIITDDTTNRGFCPPLPLYSKIEYNGGGRVTDLASVTDFQAVREVQPGKVTTDTFDYKAPKAPRLVEVPTVADQGAAPKLEQFDGTPGYAYTDTGEGQRYARQRMEGFEARAKYFDGKSDCADFQVGKTFVLEKHFWFDPTGSEPDRVLLLKVKHVGVNNITSEHTANYSNEFDCQRSKIPYRPTEKHLKPRIHGLQTAIVTGPPGMEIWTNEHGCITVHFHWDRKGPRDERSSCWIRVAQPWAGNNWGAIAIPRIGQEVVVGFMEGDPDRPLVLGSMYNADQPVPYALPAGDHMMGFKSNSTPGGGGYNEMVIHDAKDKELINIHAQKDMKTTVQHTDETVVNGPHQTNDVTKGFQTNTVHEYINVTSKTQHIHLTAATNIVLQVGQSKITMTSEGKIDIEGVHVTVRGSNRIDLNP